MLTDPTKVKKDTINAVEVDKLDAATRDKYLDKLSDIVTKDGVDVDVKTAANAQIKVNFSEIEANITTEDENILKIECEKLKENNYILLKYDKFSKTYEIAGEKYSLLENLENLENVCKPFCTKLVNEAKKQIFAIFMKNEKLYYVVKDFSTGGNKIIAYELSQVVPVVPVVVPPPPPKHTPAPAEDPPTNVSVVGKGDASPVRTALKATPLPPPPPQML